MWQSTNFGIIELRLSLHQQLDLVVVVVCRPISFPILIVVYTKALKANYELRSVLDRKRSAHAS